MAGSTGRIAIFGVTGFIGAALLTRLAGQGRPLRGVSRQISAVFRDRHAGPTIELLEANLKDAATVATAMRGVDTVVQLVCTSNPGQGNAGIAADILDNVLPHVAAIRAATAAGVRRYVFLSSGGAVYGHGAPVPTPEEVPTWPVSSHGVAKLTIENYLALFGAQDDLDFVILRPANPFGPGQTCKRGQGLIPAVLDRVARGQPVQVFGDGRARRDFLFIDDLLDAVERAIDHPAARQQVFNIGSGRGTSVNRLLAAMETVLGRPIARDYLPPRTSDVPVSILDFAKAQAVLGWRPRTSLPSGLRTTLAAWGGVTPLPRAGRTGAAVMG